MFEGYLNNKIENQNIKCKVKMWVLLLLWLYMVIKTKPLVEDDFVIWDILLC